MKISKLYSKKNKAVSKVGKVHVIVKHKFRIIPADDINNNRSSAYQYLAF